MGCAIRSLVLRNGKSLNPAHGSTALVTSCMPAESVCNALVCDRRYIDWTKEEAQALT